MSYNAVSEGKRVGALSANASHASRPSVGILRGMVVVLTLAWFGAGAWQEIALNLSILAVTRDDSGGVLIFDRVSDSAEAAAERRIAAYCGARSFRIISREYVAFGTRPDPKTGVRQPLIRYRMAYACARREARESPHSVDTRTQKEN